MEVFSSLPGNLISYLITGALGLLLGLLISAWKKRKKLGHLTKFIGDSERVSIVFSGLSSQLQAISKMVTAHYQECEAFKNGNAGAKVVEDCEFLKKQPRNVPFGPTSEGAALARLYLALHQAVKLSSGRKLLKILRNTEREVRIGIEAAQEFDPENADHPFISIGGASINPVSKRLIRSHGQYFRIRYPNHEVFINKKRCCEVDAGKDGMLSKDFGFILCGRNKRGAPFIVVWGVFAFGSLIAARAVIELAERQYRKDEKKKVAKRESLFLVVRAQVDGYQILHDRVEPEYMVPEVP